MKSLVLGLVALLCVAAAVVTGRDYRHSCREWERLVREAERLDAEVEDVQLRNALRRVETPVLVANR